jgi:tRNA(Ile)-lysidine synthase
MINLITRFFKERYNSEFPILLALSGGPDSLALLHLLLEFAETHPLKLAVAHVDHGWREESGLEAAKLMAMTKDLGLLFHLQKLDPKELKGNLEAACREERLKFFSRLCEKHGYQAVLLAHHADDVAETVLKRTLEGATLSHLAGIRSETKIQGMKIWRPLLSITKAEILQWLADRQLIGFVDKTNFDPKFLRSRMRMQIIPHLSETFGKEISARLCQISLESEELRHYLEEQIQPHIHRIVNGKLANFLDLSENGPKNIFEMKYLIRFFCKKFSLSLSRNALAKTAQQVLEKKANKVYMMGKGVDSKILYIDRGCLVVLNNQLFSESGLWNMHIEKYTYEQKSPSNWKSLLQFGRGEVILPEGEYSLEKASTSLSKWWTDQKVPAFFRLKVPVIIEGNIAKHEFLSGKRLNKAVGDRWVKITIFLRDKGT